MWHRNTRSVNEKLKNNEVELHFKNIFEIIFCSGIADIDLFRPYVFFLTHVDNRKKGIHWEDLCSKLFTAVSVLCCTLCHILCVCIVEYMSGQHLTFMEKISSFH